MTDFITVADADASLGLAGPAPVIRSLPWPWPTHGSRPRLSGPFPIQFQTRSNSRRPGRQGGGSGQAVQVNAKGSAEQDSICPAWNFGIQNLRGGLNGLVSG